MIASRPPPNPMTLEACEGESTPMMDALFARKEPKTGTDGTMSWTVNVFPTRARETTSCWD